MTNPSTKDKSAGFAHFVTAKRGRLMDGTKPLRFVSFNVPNLFYIEDDMCFDSANPYRLPTEFEIRDVLATIRELGGQVVRSYTLPVRSTDFPSDAPSYVLGPGRFDEEAFRTLDLVLALANAYGIRLILPLVNNWQWMGGRANYAAFREKSPNDFWTDPQLIDDFKATIRFVLERRNTITGTIYKDDKAILCWETGNELFAPFSWTADIARFIKSIDANHLVMDGSRGDLSNRKPSIQLSALSEPAIDIVTTHHYETDAAAILSHIEDTITAIDRRKVYLIGEFGFASAKTVDFILGLIAERETNIAGALIWSLRFHNRDGGFYWHSEPFGGIHKALHWPGFPSGQAYDEARIMAIVRRYAFEIRGLTPSRPSLPQPPKLLAIERATAISWQGAMGAISYVVERAQSPDGPWEQAGPNVSDADVPTFPLFNDATAEIGRNYYYRVLAVNSSGISKPSQTVGPVAVHYKAKIDTMKNLGEAADANRVEPVGGNDRSFKEIRNRLAGKALSELVYRVPGRFRSFALYAFEQYMHTGLQILGSTDGNTWRDLAVVPAVVANTETNYDYWRPKLYRYESDAPLQFIKIAFNGVAQLARVEITYL
jgi:mannan endo-1,4-beta-mannosidase